MAKILLASNHQTSPDLVALTTKSTQQRVPGVGNPGAEIVLVGEAPGADELNQGMPFVGPAGKFLDILLSMAGIRRKDLWVTNVVKVRPPNNKMDLLYRVGHKPQDFVPELDAELGALTSKKVIIPLGDWAMWAVLGMRGISKWRGSVLRLDHRSPHAGTWVVPTLHPSYVSQYAYKLHTTVVMDLKRARSVAANGWSEPRTMMQTKPDFDQAVSLLRGLKKAPRWAWDLETFGSQIACIGFASSNATSFSVPFKHGFRNYFERDQERTLWNLVGELMDSGATKIGHNAFRFDNEYMLKLFGQQPAPPHFDTLLAHALVSPDLPHPLYFLTSIYTKMRYYKDDVRGEEGSKKFDPSRTERGYFEKLWSYNCRDVLATYECYEGLTEDLVTLGMLDFFQGYIQPLYRRLFDIQNTGGRINEDDMIKMSEEYQQVIDSELVKVQQASGKALNPNSPKQLQEFLYQDLGLPVQYERDPKGGRKVSTSEASLNKLIDMVDHKRLPQSTMIKLLDASGSGRPRLEALESFIKVRKKRKIVGTYLNPATLSPGSRLKTSYGITETGRLSSKSRHDGLGTNLQNQPAEVKCLFQAQPGWELSESDLSQAEARAVAHLSKCQTMIDEFARDGGDVFTLIGSWVFNKPQPDVTKGERQLCKKASHGSHYGMGIRTFAENIGVSMPRAKTIQEKYFQAFPEIRLWQEGVRSQLNQTSRLATPLGRVRMFTGRKPLASGGHETYKEALASVPQSMVGDALNQGLVKLGHGIDELNARSGGLVAEIWLQVHDSVLCHYRKDLRATMVDLVKECFSDPIIVHGKPLSIPIEIEAGPTWADQTLIYKG